MAIYLEDNELEDAYDAAALHARKYFEPFDEYERLAANRIRGDLPKHYPRVNDGSLSSLLLETAKRVFPQLYTGKFTSLDRSEPWLLELINILWNRVIVPGAETDADFYTKFWNMHYRVEQHGAAAAFAFYSNREGCYRGADFSIDYIRDILLEPGKVSDLGSDYIWRRSYLSKLQLKRIIDRAEEEEALAKHQKRESFNTWVIPVLKELYDKGPSDKDTQDKNLSEREKSLSATHFKLATAYHRGVEAPFITIAPTIEGKVARRRPNEDPTGDIPIILMYHTQDLVNPYGKGIIEVAGANQNVLDHFTQSDVLATQKGMEPPVKIGGDRAGLVMRSIVHGPNAMWKIGSAKVDVVDTNSSIYQYLGDRMGRYKSNLMNQVGSFDSTVSGTSGNPQFSKTDAGVNNLESRTDVNDNFFANSGRTGFKRLAKTLMNIHMANMHGSEVFDLLEDEIERLERGGWKFEGSTQANLDYEKLRGKFDFKPEDQRQSSDPEKEGLLEGIKLFAENETAIEQIEAGGKYKVDVGEAYRQYFGKLNLSQIDKIIIPQETTDGTTGDAIGGTVEGTTDSEPADIPTTDAEAAAATTGPKPPSTSISFKDMPAAGKIQLAAQAGVTLTPEDFAAPVDPNAPAVDQPAPGFTPEGPGADTGTGYPDGLDPALQEAAEEIIKHYDMDDQQAEIVVAALVAGVTPEEIIESIHGKVANV